MSLRQNEENIQSIVKETGSTQTDTNYPASWNPEFKNKVRWSSGLTFHCVFKEKPSSSGQPDGTLSSSPHSHAQSTVEHSLRDVKHHRVQDLQFSTEFKCSDFQDEYRPLPSPTRSSLRSPGKSPCRPKEGMRVTFADSHIEKEVASSRCSPQTNRRTAGLRSPTANGQETTGAEGTQTGRAAPAGRGSRASDSCAVPHSACSSLTHHTITVVEPGASGVNKPLSDLYVSMHLEDAASSRCFSEGLSPRQHWLSSVLKENNSLRTQISSTQVSALSATGENKLQEAYRGLRERVGTVSEKITQSHKLEEALCLLRDSHRSLVSTNDYLLKQLERGSSGQDLDHVQACLTSDLSRASNGLQSSSAQHTLPSPSQ